MKRKIILVILIVIVLAILGALVFSQGDRATDTQINFISNSTLKSGDNVTFELKDAQGNVLANKNVSITYVKDGETQNFTIVTDSNGRGYLTLNNEDPGSCQVIVSFAGDDKCNPSRATQSITIEDSSSESTLDSTYDSTSYSSDTSYSSSYESSYTDSNVESDSSDTDAQAGQSSEDSQSGEHTDLEWLINTIN